MYIVAGLGNPGKNYENTRHNVGFKVIDNLSKKLDISVDKFKFKALIGEGKLNNEKIMLVKPQTYMNLSGESIKPIVDYFKVDLKKTFIIYDDIDLELGKLRIRKKGSSGSHNGMKNIIYMLNSDEFPRFRIGISNRSEYDLKSYVLSSFSKSEIDKLDIVLDSCSKAIIEAIDTNLDMAMNKYNIR